MILCKSGYFQASYFAGVSGAFFVYQVFLPASFSGFDVLMTERAAVGGLGGLGNDTSLVLDVFVVGALVDALLAPGALLELSGLLAFSQ